MNNKATAKDFFLHLGAIITFYASAIALITLLFQVINFAYPKVVEAYQYYNNPSISLQVATLIVAFPLFLILSWILQKSYSHDPLLLDAPVRKWLAYITLFVAGGVTAGDLVTLIYMFLDGQELTTGFLLKVLALFLVAGGIFFYYFREIRAKISGGERNVWRIVASVFIVASIVVGFMIIGSPATQRARRYDNARVMALQNIQSQIIYYFQLKRSIPDKLEDLVNPVTGFVMPHDPKTGALYEYKLIGQSAKAFELCATFDREGSEMTYGAYGPSIPTMSAVREPAVIENNWKHPAGRYCFSRTIDPELYPAIKS